MEIFEKSNKKENIESIIKALFLSALLFLSNPDSKAQGVNLSSGEKLKEISGLVTEAKNLSEKIYQKLSKKIDYSSGQFIGFNQIGTGYSIEFLPKDPNNPAYIRFKDDDKERRIVYIDKNGDGMIDRFYIDRGEKSELERNTDELFIDTGNRDIDLFEIEKNESGFEVEISSLKNNLVKKRAIGQDASDFVYGIQESYKNDLEFISKK